MSERLLSEALELLNELIASKVFPEHENLPVEVLKEYLDGVLAGFVGIPRPAHWFREEPTRLRLRVEGR